MRRKAASGKALSLREREVCRLTAAGKELLEIGAELGIGIKSVGTYRERIKQKTGVRNSVEMTLWWQKNGTEEA